MSQLFDFFFGPYANYSTIDVCLEITAVFFGFLSVWFAKQNNVLVYPTGMVSTAIFVYLLLKWGLLGDMMINAYYFIMSIYGWYIWTRKGSNNQHIPISNVTKKERNIGIVIFVATLLFVSTIYTIFDKFTTWVAYIDTFTTAIFFVGMWFLARRKIENWLFWIVGDIISIPLYFYKGFTLTSLQYLIFVFIAVQGYMVWKKHLNNNPAIV